MRLHTWLRIYIHHRDCTGPRRLQTRTYHRASIYLQPWATSHIKHSFRYKLSPEGVCLHLAFLYKNNIYRKYLDTHLVSSKVYCTQAFSSCGAVGLAVVPCGLLIAVASFVAEYRLQGSWSSAIVAHRLSRSDHWTAKEVLHLLDNY